MSSLNQYSVLSLMPEYRKRHFKASIDSNIFWGSMLPDPPSERGLMAPEVLQLPTLLGSAAFLLKPLILIMKIR